MIILLAGYSCAGKSTIAEVFCKKTGFSLIRHQVLIDELTALKGYGRTRHWLAEVGMEGFSKATAKEVVKRVGRTKRHPGVLVDATYFPIPTFVKQSFPLEKVVVVYVSAPPKLRVVRIMQRGKYAIYEAEKELCFRDGFLKEAGVDKVISNCDFTVLNVGDVKEAVDDLIKAVANPLI